MHPPTTRRTVGFTLIELLVVISIIALLVAILLPALTKARESARSTACLTQTRQVSMAANAYSVDFKGAFPYQPASPRAKTPWYSAANIASGNWIHNVLKYTNTGTPRTGFICPTTQHRRQLDGGDVERMNTYFANGVVTDLGGTQFLRPSSIIFTGDEPDVSNANTMGAVMRPSLNSSTLTYKQKITQAVWTGFMRFGATANPPGAMISDRPHDGGRNHGFMDGHGEFIKWEDNTSLKYGLLIQGEDKHEGPSPDYTAPDRVGVVKF